MSLSHWSNTNIVIIRLWTGSITTMLIKQICISQHLSQSVSQSFWATFLQIRDEDKTNNLKAFQQFRKKRKGVKGTKLLTTCNLCKLVSWTNVAARWGFLWLEKFFNFIKSAHQHDSVQTQLSYAKKPKVDCNRSLNLNEFIDPIELSPPLNTFSNFPKYVPERKDAKEPTRLLFHEILQKASGWLVSHFF